MFRTALAWLLVATLAAPARGLAEDNQVVNATFQGQLDPWSEFTGFGVSAEFSVLDADGDPGSGSGLGRLPADSTFRFASPLSQVIDVDPDSLYLFGAEIFIPGGQSTANRAQLFVNTWDNSGCFGNPIADTVVATGFASTQNQWTLVMADLVTLPQTRCLRLHLRFSSPAGEDMQAHVDNVFLEKILPPEAVFTSGFEE